MSTDRPVLTAQWRDLLLLNFTAPVAAIEPLVPRGTKPDLHDGQAWLSVVGFRFHETRLLRVPVPRHTHFDEVNLRFYVRRVVGDEARRGVVFIREIVPRHAVALIANRWYNENYVTRRMRSSISMAGASLAPGDSLEYSWRSNSSLFRFRSPEARWNSMAARVAAPLALPAAGSLDEFLVEHYWGYVRGRDGQTREYRVAHPPWRVARAENAAWDCDVPSTYNTPLAQYLSVPPAVTLIAEGSRVEVFAGRPVEI
jgi:uncharacterized protein YqjF (DUF2071 family)